MKADAVTGSVEAAATEQTKALGPPPETNRRSKSGKSVAIAALTNAAKKSYAQKDLEAALEISGRILAIDPDNIIALRYSARILTQRGENDRSEPIWRRLFQTAADRMEAAIALARIAYARGEWETMAEFADLALHDDAERTDALRLAIQARVKSKRSAELADLLPRLYEKEPERGMAVLRTLGGPDLVQAQAAVLGRLKAAGEDPPLRDFTEECRKAWLTGARRAASKNDDDLTACYLRAIWSFDPNAHDATEQLNALSRERLKYLRMAIKKDDRPAALNHAESVVEFNPASFEAWFALGRLALDEQPGRAAEGFRACAGLKPEDPYYQVKLGLALEKAGEIAEAIVVLEDAVSRFADDRDPSFLEAAKLIPGLKQRALDGAVRAARGERLDEAWAHYRAAVKTRAGTPGAARSNSLALAMFWGWFSIAWMATMARSLGRRAASAWTRTRRRILRLRERILSNLAATSARGRAGGTLP